MSTKKITIMPSGPYSVPADIPLDQILLVDDGTGATKEWEKGQSYGPHKEEYHLCRCGHSKNKPYCDGTHVEAGFVGHETASHEPYLDNVTVYEGERIDLLDNEQFCAVARFCDADPSVWEAAEESHKEGYREIAVKKACNCISGRLVAAEKNGAMIEPELEQGVSLVEDVAQNCKGPLWVKGGIAIEDSQGRAYEVRNRVTLCRCGNSSNMPFCDASHLQAPHMKGLDRK